MSDCSLSSSFLLKSLGWFIFPFLFGTSIFPLQGFGCFFPTFSVLSSISFLALCKSSSSFILQGELVITAAEDGFLPWFEVFRFGAGTGIISRGETHGAG